MVKFKCGYEFLQAEVDAWLRAEMDSMVWQEEPLLQHPLITDVIQEQSFR